MWDVARQVAVWLCIHRSRWHNGAMPTRKIADLPKPCRHPDHDPPKHMVFDDGVYEHTCAGCGQTQRFEVSRPMMMADARLRAATVLASGTARTFAGMNRIGPGGGQRLVDEIRGTAIPPLMRRD
jgi:hypothetical protein